MSLEARLILEVSKRGKQPCQLISAFVLLTTFMLLSLRNSVFYYNFLWPKNWAAVADDMTSPLPKHNACSFQANDHVPITVISPRSMFFKLWITTHWRVVKLILWVLTRNFKNMTQHRIENISVLHIGSITIVSWNLVKGMRLSLRVYVGMPTSKAKKKLYFLLQITVEKIDGTFDPSYHLILTSPYQVGTVTASVWR